VVIEGADRSGALITARCAKEQERALYALPGNVDNRSSHVSNVLIKNGAKLITDAYDVVSDFEFVYLGKLNPFRMAEPSQVNMFDELRRFEVACVTPSDDVFRTQRRRDAVREDSAPHIMKTSGAEPRASAPDRSLEIFDKTALEIYKRIPVSEECSIESLVREGEDIRTVMKALLTLDMGNFIDMLPGEQVKRKED
jgi:predicted Rossmann fold nucleotide-binding protein DprA/Smf involved in DNA uptake